MAESTATRTPTATANGPFKKLAVIVLVCLSIPIGIYAYLFQSGILGDPQFHARFADMPLMAAFHVLGGGTILIIGGFQFVASIRARRIAVHRWLGRAYLTGVLIGGIGGLALATSAAGGPVGRIGFGLLAIVWLFSGASGYRAIRRGDISRHRRWVMRNYALAFAAVTLRIQLPVLQFGFGLSFEEAYPVVAWLSWVPNLILVDWLMRGQRSPGPAPQSTASTA
jgi:uncharacterized membrane protein